MLQSIFVLLEPERHARWKLKSRCNPMASLGNQTRLRPLVVLLQLSVMRSMGGTSKLSTRLLSDISNNADSCQALFEDTSFFLPERGFLFRFLSFSLFSASTTTARL